MGVIPCNRKNCKKILCDYYFEDIGYLCDSCVREFEDEVAASDTYDGPDTIMSANSLNDKLKAFIETEPLAYRNDVSFTLNQFIMNARREEG
jgi:hypothetical protein